MSNSSLVNHTKLSPNKSQRTAAIKKITIHHVAGKLTVEELGALFYAPERKASANYGVDSEGQVGMYVEEKDRAWTSGNRDNDNQAITIEVANDEVGGSWHVSDKALSKVIKLCIDICKRNNIEKLAFTGNANGNLTMHKYFEATACPGPYLESKFSYVAEQVNKALQQEVTDMYRVQVGAFEKKENAESMLQKLKSAGFEGYIVDEGMPCKTPAKSRSDYKEGDVIKLKVGATYYNGQKIPSWVFKSTLYYRGKVTEGVVLSTQKTGAITGVVKPENIV